MDSDSAKGRSEDDSPGATAEQSFTFEEETRQADDHLQSVVETVRTQNVPQGTEPAFLFRLLF